MKPTRNSSKKPRPDKSASVQDLINEALKTRAVTLDLSGQDLTELPESLGHLSQLQNLLLKDNKLERLPECIRQLTQLKELDLSGNQLNTLPELIVRLTHLLTLDLSHNQLAALPESIGQLTQLRGLFLSDNQLAALPESIGQLTQLRLLFLSRSQLKALPESIGRLTQLQQLYLWKNQIAALPESIGQLTRLTLLDLAYNQLAGLPKSIGQLTQLQELSLSVNQLNTLPELIGRLTRLEHLDLADVQLRVVPEVIGRLTRLEHLDLADNQLRVVPEVIGRLTQLQHLDLAYNQLEALPESFRRLDSLTELHLHGNEKLGLPPEVLGPFKAEIRKAQTGVEPARPKDILEYYFRVRSDRRPLNEAKLILIGRGAAGKTCTVNRLVHNSFDREEEKTEGIQITEWPLELKGNENVRLNIWDFGGQEIMHATHQFFLTQRSLYLLVLNGRGGGEDADAEYWLKLIESFGADSPVIIVLNKIKEHRFDLNRRGLQQKYPAIRDFIETDCKDGTGRNDLLKAIDRETDRLEHLRDAFPTSWFTIKDRLAGMKENFLTFDEYRELCAEFGEVDATAQGQLASYLHSLGIALNYKDDPRLQDMHVLNPHWVTNGIYTILNSDKLEKEKGEIGLSDLSGILNADEYPLQMHRFLLDLMKKFDLCFTFPDDDAHYLIPELLDKQEPEASAEFKPEECLNFQYHYPVLPAGLLPRFIVRTHSLSANLQRWRTGVILAFEGNRALVKADVQDKKVFISVSGPTQSRRQLLAIIRSDFERVHSAIRKLNPEEMVPLPDYPNEVVPYSELFVMEENGIKQFPRVVGGEVIQIDVGELLNGVDLDRPRRKKGPMNEQKRPLRLFYSYSHRDESLRNELENHLKLLQRQGLIEPWHDRNIEVGDEWKRKIDENLERADIILLLVSSDFIASDYCYEIEMERALERHEKKEARVIPIVLRDVNWTKAPFAKLQALPKDGKPVTKWPDKDSAWRDVSEGIERVVEELFNGVDVDRDIRSRHESHRFDTALLDQRGRARLSTSASGTSININVGGQHMGDIHVGQAGAVGPGAHAHDMTFNQIWNQIKESVDLPKLAAELTTLREQMKKDAETVEHDAAVGDISKAEQAAKAGDCVKTLEYLKSAGKWAFDTATKIGTNVAAEVLKKCLLNP